MEFKTLTLYYQKMENISSRLELRSLLVQLFKESKNPERDIGLIARLTCGQVYFPWEETKIGMAEKSILSAVIKAFSIPPNKAEKMLVKYGDVGTVVEKSNILKKTSLANMGIISQKPWNLSQILEGLREIGTFSGKESLKRKNGLIRKYLAIMSKNEAKFYVRMFTDDLRIGVKDKTIIDALAVYKFDDVKEKNVIEEAYNVFPDIEKICNIALSDGKEGLQRIMLTPGIPFHVMAAQRLNNLVEIKEKLGEKFAVEWKYDGERMQIHIDQNEVTLFTRRYDKATKQFPDLIDEIRRVFKDKRLIIEGELVAFDKETKRLKPFQELMRRRRQHDIEKFATDYPVYLFIFDILLDGEEVFLKLPYERRRSYLEKLVESINSKIIFASHQKIIDSEESFELAFQESIDALCEGLMAKKLSSPYISGKRGWEWIKLKKDYMSSLNDTLDLVVIGGFHGRGRRTGMIGTFLMASYNKLTNELETVCKLGTGFTEDQLKEYSSDLQEYIINSPPSNLVYRELTIKPDIWFQPKMLFEIEAADLTISPSHTCSHKSIESETHAGISLRFPRFIRIRQDKSLEEITSSEEILEMFLSQGQIIEEEI